MFQDDLKNVIDTISKIHSSIGSKFKSNINLKKKHIKETHINGILDELIFSYINFLNNNTISIALELSNLTTQNILKVDSRVKQNNSVLHKIDKYINEKTRWSNK